MTKLTNKQYNEIRNAYYKAVEGLHALEYVLEKLAEEHPDFTPEHEIAKNAKDAIDNLGNFGEGL